MNEFNLREKELLLKAKELFDQGQMNKAKSLLDEVLEINPQNADALFLIGTIFYNQGKINQSIKAFSKVLALTPEHTEAAICLSVLYNDIGKYEEAKQVFEGANRKVKTAAGANLLNDPYINKKFAIKHFELGGLYLVYQRYDEAVSEFQKALLLDSQHLECWLQLAQTYAKKGLLIKAIDELKKLKNDHPYFVAAGVALGLLYYSNGNVLEAQEEWKKVLMRKPEDADAKMYLNLSQTATETNLRL